MAVLTFDGVVLGDVAAPCEVFQHAHDAQGQGLYEMRLCSAREEVATAHTALRVSWRLASLRGAHTIIVPGVEDLACPLPQGIVRALQQAAARGARIASICTGAFVLAATGLLDGQRVTTHWRAAPELARRHPALDVDATVLYVDNGQVLTSAGAVAGLDLCLHLVRRDHGARVAAETARSIVMPLERAGGQAQFIKHEPPLPHGDSLGPLLAWLERHLHLPLTLQAIARQACTSSRTLSRRFVEQTGTTPARWVTRARVRRAQQLLESTDWAVERIAEEVGYCSSAVLRERFNAQLRTSPTAYRRAFSAA